MDNNCYVRRNHALAFAARAHQKDVRKGTNDLDKEDFTASDTLLGPGVPYFMHPAAVGMLLLEHSASDAAVVAGILHDVLEDTEVTKELLEQEFGSEVTRLVIAESEPDKSLPWRARKEYTHDHLAATTDLDVKLIAAADKLHNVQSIQLDKAKLGEGVWQRFNATKEEQAWYYYGICDALSASGENHPLFTLLRKTVVATFGPAPAASV